MPMNGELATLAADAYVYGYPLVAGVSAVQRLYQPRASVLDGSYRIPPIRKAGRQSPSASYS
jgi:hypothetical protein